MEVRNDMAVVPVRSSNVPPLEEKMKQFPPYPLPVIKHNSHVIDFYVHEWRLEQAAQPTKGALYGD